MSLHPSASPLPSGLLRTEDALLWAVRDVITRGERSDSVTIVTRIAEDGRRSSGTVRGWYQLVDHDAGRLLLITDEPVSRVLVVELVSCRKCRLRRRILVKRGDHANGPMTGA